ncbi:MAG: tyrosine-type recombinase/integrase, partial [Candidatus Neomarinimicrobiota bacterium]|nr:tyrosine-type recombinase/integrase [Candidatus Neomarinimicrobiota bacterium]
MASLFTLRTSDGTTTYYGSVYIDGKRYRKKLSTTKSTAQKMLTQYERELAINPPQIINNEIPLVKAKLEFLKDIELTSNIHKKYFDVIKSNLTLFITFCISHDVADVGNVAVEHAKEYFHLRCKSRAYNKYQSNIDDYIPKLTPKTINSELSILKRFFNYCIDMQWIESNPFRLIKALRIPIKERYFFSDNEINMILENGVIFKRFYEVLLYTGIRPTDCYKLAKKHLQGRYLTLRMNKTGHRLSIPLSNHVISILEALSKDSESDETLLFKAFKSDRQKKNCVKTMQSNFTTDFVRKNNINLHTFR